MSNKMFKKATACALSAVMAFGVVAVTDTAKTTDVSAATKKVKKLSFKKKGYVMKSAGRWMNVRLRLNYSPKSSKTKNLIYKTSNKKIATVSKTGILRTKKKGTVTITAIAKNNKKAKATMTLTVGKVVKTLKFKQGTKKTLTEGQKYKLRPTYKPSDAATKSVTWKSSNTKVATVTAYGTVKAKKAGTATITATAKDAGKKKATFKVTVKKAPVKTVKKDVTETVKAVKSGDNVTYTVAANAKSYTVTRGEKKATVSAAKVSEALGYLANPAKAYTTWVNTKDRSELGYVTVTGAGEEKTVVVANTATKYDGTYTVKVNKVSDTQYTVTATKKDSKEHVINVEVKADGTVVATSAKYTVTATKDGANVTVAKADGTVIATSKKANGNYVVTVPADKAANVTITQTVTKTFVVK